MDFCCCALMKCSVGYGQYIEMNVVRMSVPLRQTCVRMDDPWKTTDGPLIDEQHGYKIFWEVIPMASGLQIECVLFLRSSSDVKNLLQVLDVSCIKCGEIELIHGGGAMDGTRGHGDGHGRWVRIEDGFQGCAHHALGKVHLLLFGLGRLVEGYLHRASPWSLGKKMVGVLGAFPSTPARLRVWWCSHCSSTVFILSYV